jgi:tripartite-type tricarboxylate transporter receptor subunit TctC
MFTFSIVFLSLILAACGSSETQSSDAEQGAASNENGSGYPTKPIQVVVPAGAGGDTDRNTRTTAKYLEQELGQSIVVSNVTGAGGTVASKEVLDANPDGYTVLAFHASAIINEILGLADFGYADFELAGISVLDEGNTFLVSGDSPFNNLQDLIDHAKENPKAVTIATEVGAHTHLQLLAFQEATGTELNIVDVGGASEKITALLGGHVDIVPTQLGLVKSYLESGDMKSLGILAPERLESMPDVPTFKEQGVDISIDKLFFWAFPPGTPEDVVNEFSSALESVVTTNEEFKAEAESFVITPAFMGPEEAEKYMDETKAYYTELQEKAE